MADAAKKTAPTRKAAAKVAAKKAVVPEAPKAEKPEVRESSVQPAKESDGDWLLTNNGVRFGRK